MWGREVTITYYPELIQGSEQWFAQRCGVLTSSEMENIVTPKKLEYAKGADDHMHELLAQRITRYVEPSYVSDAMLRGQGDEMDARIAYNKHYELVTEVGFITNNKWGFVLGYSPDGRAGKTGGIEVKSRKQKLHVQTILADAMPDDFRIQVQTGLLVSEWEWIDFISYCGGLPMFTKRIYSDPVVQQAIVDCATKFHEKLDAALKAYGERLCAPDARFLPTERKIEMEMHL